MQIPKRKPGKYAINPADDFLTPEAIKKLKDDLDRLQSRSRPCAVEDLRMAREMGDLSENAAYTEAKARLGGIDGRIFTIKERLKHAVVIMPGAGIDGSVRMGATVTVVSGEKKRSYLITGAQEAEPTTGKISYHSPLGAALMGKKSGDTASIIANGKEVVYKIIEVK